MFGTTLVDILSANPLLNWAFSASCHRHRTQPHNPFGRTRATGAQKSQLLPLTPENLTESLHWGPLMFWSRIYSGLYSSCLSTYGDWTTHLKNMLVKLDQIGSFPQVGGRGENQQCLKPPPGYPFSYKFPQLFHCQPVLVPRSRG